MQNPAPKLRQSFIISEYLSEKLKHLMSFNYQIIFTFFLKSFSFLLYNFYKRLFGIYIFLNRSWVINKNVKNKFAETRSFSFLQITEDLDKIKKSLEHL